MLKVKERYSGRKREDILEYGPRYYVTIRHRDLRESGPLPEVNYDDIGYSKSGIRMSLKTGGVKEEFWGMHIERSIGPYSYNVGGDECFDTLLFRLELDLHLHDEYEENIECLFGGFLKEIQGVALAVTQHIIESLTTIGCHYIAAPFYLYKFITLDSWWYFYYETGNESLSDEEEEDGDEEMR